MKCIEYKHNATERAHLTSCALGIHLNIRHESYGGTRSLRAMVEDEIVFHGPVADTVTYLCGLHTKINRILALFAADGIHHQDKEKCIKSLSETCAPTPLTREYLKWILGNKHLIKYLDGD
ncbi:hypothetical protein VPKG_00049 [Vibrio phage pYD21-A]|uniref:hypothetical protein n=1 Tax=Vibrio phage pYD21-A TaxID=754049 RepID=UPI0002C0B5DD|nr:hypothetical protein VPKG_00049 [Vibrio phage pYD21-A]AGH16086.1 hypothetical protein VPKG_00049 [Vibrio phage pYD21-A]